MTPMTMAIRNCRSICRSALLLLALAGCGDNLTSPETRRARWEAHGAQNYTYVSSYSCECAPDFASALETTVRNDVVAAVRSGSTGQPVPLTYRPTIDGLFDLIATEQRTRPANLEVSYDATLGYPTRIKYGTPENDGGAVITVTSLTIIP
jgi:hypothetical protein